MSATATPDPDLCRNLRLIDKLADDPTVNELADIRGAIEGLGDRIRKFLKTHGPKCSCRCCKEVNRMSTSFPNAWTMLNAVATVAWWANLLDQECPAGRKEMDEMFDSIERKRLGVDGTAA